MKYSFLASCYKFKCCIEAPRNSRRFFLKKMPGLWLYLKKSLNCKSSKSTDVLDSKRSCNKSRIRRENSRSFSSECSRTLSNLRDVIINSGNNQNFQNLNTNSPRSMESSNFLNPIKYEGIIHDSKKRQLIGIGWSSSLPRPDGEGNRMVHYRHRRSVSSVSSKNIVTDHCPSIKSSRASFDSEFRRFEALVCQKCCEKFTDLDAVEAHHISKHAVTELVEGDSSRKIVELICNTRFSRSQKTQNRVSRVFKVQNMEKTLSEFEDYRELVKIKASKISKKHPRCLADGNEHLRFHGTTIACSLGLNGSSGLCVSVQCGICRILRHGFSIKNESNDSIGVFTASTSSRALESIEVGENKNVLKALILCRVIAGRVHRPLEDFEQNSGLSGFDSVAGKLGRDSTIEELYLLSPNALLPCFVIIFKS